MNPQVLQNNGDHQQNTILSQRGNGGGGVLVILTKIEIKYRYLFTPT